MQTLGSDLRRAVAAATWDQWSALGVSADRTREETRCIDPEALLWLTFQPSPGVDGRLVDAVRAWLRLNRGLLSVHRFRNLSRAAQAGAVLDAASVLEGEPRSEPRIETAAKAREPDPMLPSNLAVRLRLLMDAGVRSEVARFLLTWPGSDADAQRVAEAAAFSKRNVSEALLSFVKAGVVRETWAGNRRVFAAEPAPWCAFLGTERDDLPGFMPWIRLFRSTVRILEWLDDDATSERSAYLRSSSARDLEEAVGTDLKACGVSVPDPQRFTGEDPAEPMRMLVDEVARALAPPGSTRRGAGGNQRNRASRTATIRDEADESLSRGT
jgi:hypothetical protein